MMHHNHHSPAMKAIGTVSWFLCSVAAIAWGLIGLGSYLGKNLNLWDMGLFANQLAALVSPLQVIIGVAGLISLLCLFTCCSHKDKR